MVTFVWGKITVPRKTRLAAENGAVCPMVGIQSNERLIRKKVKPFGKPDSKERQTNQEQNTFISNFLLFISSCIHA